MKKLSITARTSLSKSIFGIADVLEDNECFKGRRRRKGCHEGCLPLSAWDLTGSADEKHAPAKRPRPGRRRHVLLRGGVEPGCSHRDKSTAEGPGPGAGGRLRPALQGHDQRRQRRRGRPGHGATSSPRRAPRRG